MGDRELLEELFFAHEKRRLTSDTAAAWAVTSEQAAAAARKHSRLLSKLDSGKSLDFQSEPQAGSVLAVSATFARPCQHRTRQHPPEAQRQRGTAVLWGLVQPSPLAGITSAVSVAEGSISGPASQGGVSSLTHDGFLDVSRRAGVDWALTSCPDGKILGDVEISGTLPRLPILGPLTLRHGLAVISPGATPRHTSVVSLRPFNAAGVVRLRVAQAPAGDQMTLELSSDSSSISGGTGRGSGWPGGGRRGGGGGSSSSEGQVGLDSDSEECSTSDSSISGRQGGGAGAAGGGKRRRGPWLPNLKVEIPPTASAPHDLSWQWRQAWSQRSSTLLAYRAPSQQVCVEARHRSGFGLHATSQLSLDRASQEVRKAVLKLQCKLKGSARRPQHLRWEAGWTAGPPGVGSSGAAFSDGRWVHSLRYRVGRAGRSGDSEGLRGFLELGVRLHGERRARSIDIECFLPF